MTINEQSHIYVVNCLLFLMVFALVSVPNLINMPLDLHLHKIGMSGQRSSQSTIVNRYFHHSIPFSFFHFILSIFFSIKPFLLG